MHDLEEAMKAWRPLVMKDPERLFEKPLLMYTEYRYHHMLSALCTSNTKVSHILRRGRVFLRHQDRILLLLTTLPLDQLVRVFAVPARVHVFICAILTLRFLRVRPILLRW